MANDLPNGCQIVPVTRNFLKYLSITFDGKPVVTKHTGQKRLIRGIDENARNRARIFAWRFCEGYEDAYRVEP